jgi:hypothetical protein
VTEHDPVCHRCRTGDHMTAGHDSRGPASTERAETGSVGVPIPADPENERQRRTEPRDLWHAVAALTETRRQRLRRDDGATEWFTLPSLWTQLIEAMEGVTGYQGDGKLQQSRPPLNTSAMSLLIRIAGVVRDERRTRFREATDLSDAARVMTLRGRLPFETPGELRQIISDLIRCGDQPIPDSDWTLFEWWESQIRSWASQIRATIGQAETWRLYGAACRTCQALTVPAFDPETGEAVGRQPALVVHSSNDVVTSVTCDMCGSALADVHLQRLWDDAHKAKPAEATA